jgi:hypothetical protein
MKTVILSVLVSFLALAQSTPPGGGKVAAVVGPRGSGAPSMGCSAGMLYMRPGTGLYVCTTTDTWALLAAGAGSGDVVGPAASVDGEAAVYDGITGKLLKRFSGSGIGIFTSGVLSVSSALQWNATTGVGLIKPLTLGQFAGDIGTLNLNGTSARLQILPAAATAEWTLTLPPNDGDSGQVLRTDGSGVATWITPAAGNMVNTGTPTATAVPKYSSTSGTAITPSGVLIDASDNITGVSSITIDGAGASNLTGIAAPAGTPAAGTSDIFINSGTSYNFWVKSPADAYTHTVATKTRTGTEFLTAISDAGVVSAATIAAGDLPATLTSGTAITNASLTTPNIGAATGTSLVATGIVSGLAPVTYLQDADPCPTGTHCAVGATYNMGYIINGATTEASATFFDLPSAVAGQQYCFENGAGNSGATTGVMKVIAASGDYITLLGVKSGTSGTTATSGGAAGDAACFIAVKGDEWVMKTSGGTWTTN